MSDWLIIDRPVLPPAHCIGCGGGIQGPVIDTRRDIALLPDGGRVYLCKPCAKLASTLFGFAPGEKLDELHEASELLSAAWKEQADAKEREKTLEDTILSKNEKILSLETELELANGRADQLQATIDRMVADARSQLAAVGAVDIPQVAEPILEPPDGDAEVVEITGIAPPDPED